MRNLLPVDRRVSAKSRKLRRQESPKVSAHRSRMRAVRRFDTDIEIKLRKLLWHAGVRYRTNARVSDAKPDIVVHRARMAIFVDGCFWHGCPKHYRAPLTNQRFWRERLARNRARDKRDTKRLRASNWCVLRFWQCQINGDPFRVSRVILGHINLMSG